MYYHHKLSEWWGILHNFSFSHGLPFNIPKWMYHAYCCLMEADCGICTQWALAWFSYLVQVSKYHSQFAFSICVRQSQVCAILLKFSPLKGNSPPMGCLQWPSSFIKLNKTLSWAVINFSIIVCHIKVILFSQLEVAFSFYLYHYSYVIFTRFCL